MELKVCEYRNYFYVSAGIWNFLYKDGTITTDYRVAEINNWKTQREAQQFLDYWMPRKEQLTISEVKEVVKFDNEKIALDCSIEHWKQNVLDVGGANVGSSYCAMCVRAGQNDTLSGTERCKHCIVNDYKWSELNCCKEYEDFVENKTEENATAMLNKLVLIRNKKYGNPYNVEEKKMAKIEFDDGVKVELSKETTERLRKELVKPEIEWKHGDIALSHWLGEQKRLILIEDGKIKIYQHNGSLLYSDCSQDYIKDRMEEYKYERIGNLFDDFSN